jgi:hypothetical protein
MELSSIPVGFTIKKFVTMHGHVNVKNFFHCQCSQIYASGPYPAPVEANQYSHIPFHQDVF